MDRCALRAVAAELLEREPEHETTMIVRGTVVCDRCVAPWPCPTSRLQSFVRDGCDDCGHPADVHVHEWERYMGGTAWRGGVGCGVDGCRCGGENL